MSTLKLKGSSSGEAEVTVAAAAGTPTFTLPTTVGSANQLLKNSGSAGTLEYSSNLTYDGSDLAVGAGNLNVSKPAIPTVLVQNSTDTSYSTVKLQQSSGSGGYFAVTKLGTNSSATGGANAAQLWQSGNAPMVFGTNNTERMRIAADGHVSITSGNLEFANGAGVDFSNVPDGSRSISTDGNKFDDYEEGTFTATCSSSVTLHTSANDLVYTKIGRLVTVQGQIRVNDDNNDASPFNISNMPFPNVDFSDGADVAIGAVRLWDWDLPSGVHNVVCMLSGGGSNLQFWCVKDNTGAGELPADSDAYAAFSITYMTTS